ncbi:YaiO family outer membrane beta-barrel protein [Leeuwenhoekiella parthenopeia]|uniref:YaiO family outer membrane beta-barrel protein n=1 Tax=Leeuwenhoekiella parthenopeia TaxID=2890320 RepID=A0ABS8GVP2_9FLAO|nr:YaiO family outer membrane beta-barrel protein [Leeuwenhoekiella parthenopeia]MCC4213277.1 YaiO family outer membrane beta-barrel protein [Leeuwenhoekiella parthenopeia]
MKWVFTLILTSILGISDSFGQEQTSTPDALYREARLAAFDNQDYARAVSLLKQGLDLAPAYLEMRVFLGRVYTFSDSLSLARKTFEQVLQQEEGHEEASLGYGYLEYWNKNTAEALKRINKGLEFHPDSESLGVLKAKILYELRQPEEASSLLDAVLATHPGNTEARSLQQRQNSLSTKNAVGVSYEYVYFDKRFDDPWHIAFADYSRQTGAGLFTARVNYASRFNQNALQAEAEAYPRISERFYGFINLGISDDTGVFPRFRAGVNLYANLPAAFEVDAGIRYLVFDEDQFIYTLGAGKYLKNFWLNLRTYIIPNDSELNGSVAFTLRYYLGGRDDYLGLRLGTGLSPDDSANSVLFDGATPTRLRSKNAAAFWRTPLGNAFVLNLETGIEDQQFTATDRGIQLNAVVGLIRRF